MTERHSTTARCRIHNRQPVWRARCSTCGWESEPFRPDPDSFAAMRTAGRAHQIAPTGADRVDAALADWVRR